MIYEDLNFLSEKRVYLAPYNDLTIQLSSFIPHFLGFVDNTKVGINILKPTEIIEYDYIIIYSPAYWIEISKDFNLNKILLKFKHNLFTYYEYLNYLHELKTQNCYDIVFLAHNKAHALDIIPIINSLKTYNFKIATVNITNHYQDEGAHILLKNLQEVDYIEIDLLKVNIVTTKLFICLNDWEKGLANYLVQYYNLKNIPTIGIVEGITDFEDSDYKCKRNPYHTVEYIFVTGRNDLKYLKNKKTFIVGIPKILPLVQSKISFPNKILIVINLSFVALTYNDESIFWLEDVVSICNELQLDYTISQHPSDKTNLKNYNVTQKTIYEAIESGTLLISRFSTTILESITLGKPAVYYKPKKETITLYDNNNNAFSIATNKNELKEKIIYELNNKHTIRQRSNQFLDNQCNINEKEKPEILATRYIIEILKQHQ